MMLNLFGRRYLVSGPWIGVVAGTVVWGVALLFVAYHRGFWPWGG